MRAAIYYAPALSDPLWAAGTCWLGRDPERGVALVQPDVAGITAATAAPRRYGFHATIKPPMRLAFGLDALIADVRELLAGVVPFEMPGLRVSRIDGFIALTGIERSAALQAVADLCVTGLERHRVAESAAEMARRAGRLDEHGRRLLARYGYGHVLDRWQFHMTLSERLADGDALEAAARGYFAAALGMARRVEGVAVFVEDKPGAAFRLVGRVRFGEGKKKSSFL